ESKNANVPTAWIDVTVAVSSTLCAVIELDGASDSALVVSAALTTWDSRGDVASSQFASPEYTALILCVPLTGNANVQVAVAAATGCALHPSVSLPSTRNCTWPVANTVERVAVHCTACSLTLPLGREDERVRITGAGTMSRDTEGLDAARNNASPE